jgi:hypothetical protein
MLILVKARSFQKEQHCVNQKRKAKCLTLSSYKLNTWDNTGLAADAVKINYSTKEILFILLTDYNWKPILL